MHPRLRRLRDLVAAVTAALSMLVAPMLAQGHEAAVHHVRCIEHGELIELADDGPDVHQDHHAPVAVPGHVDRHHSHCTIDLGRSSALVAVRHPQVAHGPALTDSPVLRTAAPRGSPALSYAPKTSPPSRV